MPYKRGPKTPWSDEALKCAIISHVADSPFHSEGHRKVLARLRRSGIQTSKKRVLRLMAELGILQKRPRKSGHRRDATPEGGRKIVTSFPNVTWGIDSTNLPLADGSSIALFAVLEHWNSEVLAWLLSPSCSTVDHAQAVVRGAIRRVFGSDQDYVASGVSLRLDHWEVHLGLPFLARLHRWGIEPFFIFPMRPQQNGVAERFFRTLKEELSSSTSTLADYSDAAHLVGQLISSYNSRWLLARLGYRSPEEWRRQH